MFKYMNTLIWTVAIAFCPAASVHSADPNVVLILCDDLGYGDVGAFNPDCKIATPVMDRIADQGVRFTNAHSSSSVCTPTRYALLTGRYNWRTRLASGVLGGTSPPLIADDQLTIASMLQTKGYQTACFGKWHLGLQWQRKSGKPAFNDAIESGPTGWDIDFSKPILDGPLQHGFDRFFGISASLDMVPYAFINQALVVNQPDHDDDFPMSLDKVKSRTRRGPTSAGFEAQNVLPEIIRNVVDWIDQSKAQASPRPFFAYVPLASPHTPIVPTLEFQGASKISAYADFVMQTDAAIGQILDCLDRNELADNTLFIVTSDNGCSPQADYPKLAEFGHDPSGDFRGTKADIFEGGHRVPYLVRWPARFKAGSTCTSIIGLQDTLASLADLLNISLTGSQAPDSVSWLGQLEPADAPKGSRESLVHHSINGSFAITRMPWKLCLCPDSGGWSDPKPNSPPAKDLPKTQLFNLETDLSESRNVASENPEIVAKLTAELQSIVFEAKGRDGKIVPNDRRSIETVK